MLEPLGNNILFIFEDKHKNGMFVEESEGGIHIGMEHSAPNKDRWGKVVAIGPDVIEDIKNGDRILIEKMQWTTGFEHDGVEIWSTNDKSVMAVM